MLIYRIDHNLEKMAQGTFPKKVKVESSVHLTNERDPKTGDFGIVVHVVYDFGKGRQISFGVVTRPDEFIAQETGLRMGPDNNDEEKEGRLDNGRF